MTMDDDVTTKDVTPNACPFCGELATTNYRSRHMDAHRHNGDVPLPMTAEVIQNPDGTWGFTLVLTDSGLPVLIPKHFQSRVSRQTAEKCLKRYMNEIANGAGVVLKSQGRGKRRTTAVTEPVSTNGASVDDITDEDIVNALVKLTGVTAIPAKRFSAVADWVAQTRKLAQEVQR
jgi:hypothetical protein